MSQIAHHAATSVLQPADQSATSVFGQLAASVRNAFASAIRIYRYRKAVAELRQMDRRMLADIGIDRSEIVSVVYGDPTRRR